MLNNLLTPISRSWQWRHFIISSIRNDLKVRFSRSVLGGLWMLLNPLAMVLMYTVILSAVLSAKLPGIDNRFAYAIYLISGMLGWTLFLEIVQRCINVFIEHANQIKKINFPKITLPIIVTGTSLIGYVTLVIVTFIVFACLSHLYWQGWLWIPILTVITAFLAVGFGIILGVVNVFVRDLGQLMNIVLQLLFWFTPIVYPAHIVPESLQFLQQLNPLYHIIESYHQVLAYNQAPSVVALSGVFALSCLLMWFALRVYRKASPEMMDVL